MAEFRERLHALRKARKLTQKQVASRLDRPQAWISNRETGAVTTSTEEAIEILRAMGYAADLVVVDGAQPQLLELVARSGPDEATLALRLLEVLPQLSKERRDMLKEIIDTAVKAAADRKAGAAS